MSTPASPPDSPCSGVCRLDSAGICLGCGRRMNEIAEWPNAGPERKHEIIAAARERMLAMQRQA